MKKNLGKHSNKTQTKRNKFPQKDRTIKTQKTDDATGTFEKTYTHMHTFMN